jgi:hypothetical protein
MEFDKELGPQKGSWKGGILGTGIDMEPGEKHIDAMKRFCSMQHREKHNARYQVEFIE